MRWAVAAAEPTCKTAVIVHGYTDNSIRMLNIGYLYNRQPKYNILLPDLHGHGQARVPRYNGLARPSRRTAMDRNRRRAFRQEQWNGDRRRQHPHAQQRYGMVDTASRWELPPPWWVSGEVEHGIHQQTVHQMFRRGLRLYQRSGMNSGRTESTIRLARFPAAACGTAGFIEQEHGWDREASALGRSGSVPCPCSLYTAMRTLCSLPWMVYPLYAEAAEPKSCGLFRVSAHAVSQGTIRRNIRARKEIRREIHTLTGFSLPSPSTNSNKYETIYLHSIPLVHACFCRYGRDLHHRKHS